MPDYRGQDQLYLSPGEHVVGMSLPGESTWVDWSPLQ